ncbi:MAG TPA: hypothetical protein VLL51_01925 [Gemmatimonadales bacterium]|nr:hypothetical protein [Gemmatimonadales bacterium]
MPTTTSPWDGARFLMVKRVQAPELFVVFGYRQELRRRLRDTAGTR